LCDLLVAERACTVIEIGLAYGASALAIAEALVANGSGRDRHIIIDAYQNRFHGSGWSAIVQAGIANLCLLLEERSQMVLPRLSQQGVMADAAFVDGSHILHNVFVDLFYLRELGASGWADCSGRLQLSRSRHGGSILSNEYRVAAGADSMAYSTSRIPTAQFPY
jgi:hypothetical protein